MKQRAQVAIIGGSRSGLLLSQLGQLLHQADIDAVILERPGR